MKGIGMNINEIVERDMADEERRQRETDGANIETRIDRFFSRVCVVIIWIAIFCAAFVAGMFFQAKRALQEQRDFDAWLERVDREAEARARSMSNTELLQRFQSKETSR